MNPENQFLCATCGRGFRSRRALGGHVKVHKNRTVGRDPVPARRTGTTNSIIVHENGVRRNVKRQCRRLRPPVYNEDESWAIILNSASGQDNQNEMAMVRYNGGDTAQPAMPLTMVRNGRVLGIEPQRLIGYGNHYDETFLNWGIVRPRSKIVLRGYDSVASLRWIGVKPRSLVHYSHGHVNSLVSFGGLTSWKGKRRSKACQVNPENYLPSSSSHGDQSQVQLLEEPPAGYGNEDAERLPTAEPSSRMVVFDFDLNLPYVGEEDED